MGYCIDLSRIGIGEYKNKLKSRTLIPSQMILKENMEQRFACFEKAGVKTVADLLALLKRPETVRELLKQECLDEEYLAILKRQINGTQAKPRKLDDFKWIPAEVLKGLQRHGIRNTKQLYAVVMNGRERRKLFEEPGLDKNELLPLLKQTDLTRIQWVNSTFARVLYEAGYDTVGKVQKADAKTLYKRVVELNKAENLYSGKIGLKDMAICIEAAGELEPEMEQEV